MVQYPADGESLALDFSDLLDRFQASLLAFLRGLLHDPEQARDLLQDVFCDAWRAWQRGSPPFADATMASDADLRNWLFHATYCRAISARRRARRMQWSSLDAPMSAAHVVQHATRSPEDTFVQGNAVRAALQALAPSDAACLLLNALYGFAAHEIGTMLDIAPEAAKKRLSRAKQRLRAAYLAQNPDAERQHQEQPSHVHE